MAKKCNCKPGAPEWVVTYGDMMSLLLCFFILLAAFSELKKPERYQDVIRALKEVFGYVGGAGHVPTPVIPANDIIQQLEEIALHKQTFRQVAAADDPGVSGRQTTVKRIREGLQLTIGGTITFEPGSAELKQEAKLQLAKVAEMIRGHNNKLEIRGHASNNDLPPGSAFKGLWDLSHARARAVHDFLVPPPHDIQSRRIRLVACANHEPLLTRVYDEPRLAVNRRIEIIVNESWVQEFEVSEEIGAAPVLPE